MSIKIENLCYSYDNSKFAVDNLSLKLEDNQIIGIVGNTGCGKSTLVQLIAGLLTPNSGKIYIDNDNIFNKKYNRSNLRKKLGIVFQFPETQLFEQSVEKDIAFGLKNSNLSKTDKIQRTKYALSLMGLDYDTFKDKSPFALSGGEKRKVAIAGVLAIKPKYLILDEPLAGLDAISRDKFMLVIQNLREQGTTIIIVSHNADSLAQYADRIIVMDNGKIAIDGSPNYVYSQYDKIEKLKLGLCSVKQIAKMLCNKGIVIDESIVRYDDLINELINKFSGMINE